MATSGIRLLLAEAAEEPGAGVLGRRVSVHRLSGVAGRGVVAVRPDGHVGFRCADCDPVRLRAWLDLVGAG
jgi:hypothetical protein